MAAVRVFLGTMTLVLLTSVVTSRPREVVDLTYTLGDDTLFWPGQPPFNFTILHRGIWKSDIWLEWNAFGLGEHGGTHIDAPAHFSRGGWRTDKIPASHLVGPGVVMDFTEQVQANELYAVTTEDLLKWEERNGRIPQGAVLLLNFGWWRRYPDPSRVFNTQNLNDTSTFRFPGMSGDAAKWLVDNRNLTALGSDTPSPDVSNSTEYPVHLQLLGNGILILEYVANLASLPTRGFEVIVGIIKLRDGSGGPARILALMDGDTERSVAATTKGPLLSSWFFVALVGMVGRLSV